jgi:hypothetical protein
LVPLAVLRDRLFASDIPAKRWGLSSTLDFEKLLDREPDALGLWIDEPWDTLSPKDLRAPPTKIVAAVFTRPINTKRSLVLREQDLFGFRAERDGTFTAVFLGPVRARDLCQVPETLAVFAKGLTVDRIASFDGGDSHTAIGGRLKAPYVVSGVGGGWAELERKTVVSIGDYARYIRGLPKGTKAVKHRSLAAMLPFLAEEAKESAAWEVIDSFIESDREIPKKRAFKVTPRRPNELRDKTFVFVGRMGFPGAMVREIVEHNGGIVATAVTPAVNYLVISDAKSALLGAGPKRKAHLTAEALNKKGASIAIIREERFWKLKKK